MCKGLLRCTLPLAVLMLASPVKAEETNTCVPNCRSGYLCHEGTCVSRCNPPCEKGSICSQTGECQAITRNPSPDAPTGGLRFAVMGGILMPGEIYANPPDGYFETDAGWILRGTADSFITRKLSVGGYLNYISSKISYGSLSSDLSIVGIGVTMKLSFEISTQMSLRAGIGIGYQMTDAADVGEYGEDITGFDLAPITELAVKSETGLTYLVSIAGFSQPAGGNEEADVEWSPILFFSGGIQFGG